MTKTIRYEIRDAIRNCGYGLESAVADCYSDRIVIEVTDDAKAIQGAKLMQACHDAKAIAVIEAAEKRGEDACALRQSYENAPCYVAHLWKIALDEDGEEIEEPVEY